MKRKIVKLGPSTLVVALPKHWTAKFDLNKGDEINLDEIDNKVVISQSGIERKKETEIDLKKQTETGIRTLITNAYRAGYNLVKVKFENEKQLRVIRNTLKNYLLGYDIIKKQKNFIVIENITEPAQQQFDVLIRKVFFSIKELTKLTKERLQNKKNIDDYRELTLTVHKYDSFCRRVLSKNMIDTQNIGLLWAFQALIVHGQRDIYHLNRFLDNNKIRVSPETIKLLDSLIDLFEFLMNAYLKKDISLLEDVHEMEKSIIYKKANTLISKTKGKENVVIHHIMDSVRNFYLASSPLMGLLLSKE